MKSIIKIYAILSLFLLAMAPANAQEKQKKIETAEFEVAGVCDMCKKRIEYAALIKGVKMAEWDKESQMLKVIYKAKKVSEEEIHYAVAEAGHDTEKKKSTDKAYQKLPDCCAYRDGLEVH